MAYYKICPKCGATLDPGEHCDCEKEREKQEDFYSQKVGVNPKNGQCFFRLVDDKRVSA